MVAISIDGAREYGFLVILLLVNGDSEVVETLHFHGSMRRNEISQR